MERALVVPFLYREFCAKTLEQGDLRCWERSAKTIWSRTGRSEILTNEFADNHMF